MLSIIIPAYNNSRYLSECVRSILSQDFQDVEIIIVDDASTDDTPKAIESLSNCEPRIKPIRHETNQGTLSARSTGVEAAQGQYAMFIDQDDGLQPGTLSKLIQASQNDPADIYHFGVKVEAANAIAQQASAGMTTFLTPMPRTIQGQAILTTQFSEHQGFDWHLHHKMFRTDLLKLAYHIAAHTRLLLSDDLYMNFIIDSFATRYIALPKSPWYIYHLGRGDTLGSTLTPAALQQIEQRDAKALALIRAFATGGDAPKRDDWGNRIADARDRLIEHTMNEWKDNLPDAERRNGLNDILSDWEPDAVCGELYRYVRDNAYAYLQQSDTSSQEALAYRQDTLEYLKLARMVERRFDSAHSHNQRYRTMKSIAERHVQEAHGSIERGPRHQHHLSSWFRRIFL